MCAAKEHLNCPICLEVYRSPKSLPCLHSYCTKCLQTYIDEFMRSGGSKGKTFFKCPVCRATTFSPARGEHYSKWAGRFPPNYALLPILDSISNRASDKECDSCREESTSSPAVKFCTICKDYLCPDCVKLHQRFKATKGHRIVNLGTAPLGLDQDTTGVPLNQQCQDHEGEEIKFFCKDDGELCCGTCAVRNHRRCDQVVEIKDVAAETNRREDLKKLNARMISLRSYLKNFIDVMELDADSFEQKVSEIPEKLKEVRKTFNDIMIKLEQSVLEQQHRLEKTKAVEISEAISRNMSILAALDSSCGLLKAVLQRGTPEQVFITIHKLAEQGRQYEKMVLDEQTQARRYNPVLELDPKLQYMLQTSDPLACVNTKESPSDLPPFPFVREDVNKSSPQNRTESNLSTSHKSTRSRSLDLEGSLEEFYGPRAVLVGELTLPCPKEGRARFRDAVCLDDGRILILDELQRSLYLLDKSFKLISTLKLSDRPRSMTAVATNAVAVTLPDIRKIHVVNIGATLFEKNSVRTRLKGYCISQLEDPELLISWKDGEGRYSFGITELDHGEITFVEKLSTGENFDWFEHLVADGDRCVQSTSSDNVNCLSLEGELIWTYSHPQLGCTSGMAMDSSGNPFVCSWKTNSIHILSPDGQLMRIIRHEKLTNPKVVCFLGNKDEFFVLSDQHSTLLRFRMEKE